MRSFCLGLIALALLGCGSHDEPGSAGPGPTEPANAARPRAEEPATPATEDDAPAPEHARAPADDPRPQLVGADRSHLLFLDTGAVPWTVERVDSGPVSPLHAITFLGCGARAAARTTRALGVWDRDGTLRGQSALPNLVSTLGERLTAEVARVDRDYETQPDPALVIGVGPLVQTDEGVLAMNPTFSMEAFNGEMEGCVSPAPSLQVPLAVPGVEPAPCPRPALEQVSLTHELEEAPPSGFQCAYVGLDSPPRDWPEHFGRPLDELVASIPLEPETCEPEDVPEDPWDRLRACTRAADGGAVTVCRHHDDPRVFVALLPEGAMGCGGGPNLYLISGRRVVAETGWGAELLVLGDLWIYGGGAAWFVDGPGHAPLRFGRMRPDVVRGRP